MMDAFYVLNEGCWRMIFNLLEPQELYNCSLVCNRFDNILSSHKGEWILELVLPSIVPYLERNEPHQNLIAASFFPESRVWNELYKCRLVCKAWRRAIDEYMSRDPHRYAGPVALALGNILCQLLWQEGPGWGRFKDNDQLSEFIETFRDTEVNPFPGRKAIIYDLVEDHNEENDEEGIGAAARALARAPFRERRGEFFERFGKFLWNVQIGWNHMLEMAQNYEEAVVAYLPHLAHIRELTVGSSARIGGVAGVLQRIDVRRLPELRDLRTLVFEMVPRGLGLALLTKYGPQLTRLDMRSKNSNLFFFALKMDLLASLRDLSITLSNAHFNQFFYALRDLRSPLGKLKLVLFKTIGSISFDPESVEGEAHNLPFFRIHQLFEAITFHIQLTTLTIEMHRGELSNLTLGQRISEQQTIRTFNLIVKFCSRLTKPVHISFDFLPALINLTYFNLVYEYDNATKREVAFRPLGKVDVVCIREYIRDNDLKLMYHSNIWEKVPSLQTFSIEFKRPQYSSKRIYTRREYQEVRKRWASYWWRVTQVGKNLMNFIS